MYPSPTTSPLSDHDPMHKNFQSASSAAGMEPPGLPSGHMRPWRLLPSSDDRASTDSESFETESYAKYYHSAQVFSGAAGASSRGCSPAGSYGGLSSEADLSESRSRSSSAPAMPASSLGMLPPPATGLEKNLFGSVAHAPPAPPGIDWPLAAPSAVVPADGSGLFRDSHGLGVAPRRGSFTDHGANTTMGIAQGARRGMAPPPGLAVDNTLHGMETEGGPLSPATTNSLLYLLQDDSRMAVEMASSSSSSYPSVASGRTSPMFAAQQHHHHNHNHNHNHHHQQQQQQQLSGNAGSWLPQAADSISNGFGPPPMNHSTQWPQERNSSSNNDFMATFPPAGHGRQGGGVGMFGRPPALPPRSPPLNSQQYGTPTRHRSISMPAAPHSGPGASFLGQQPLSAGRGSSPLRTQQQQQQDFGYGGGSGGSPNSFHSAGSTPGANTPSRPASAYYQLADTRQAAYDGPFYQVQFKRCHRCYILSSAAPATVKPGDFVIVEGDRGEDLGVVVAMAPRDSPMVSSIFAACASTLGRGAAEGNAPDVHSLKKILRVACLEERMELQLKAQDELDLLEVCRERARDLYGLPMTLVDAEYQFDRHKLVLYYSASRRIDFREYVRDLFSIYKTRIWMEQATTHHSFRPSEAAAHALVTGVLQQAAITDAHGHTVAQVNADTGAGGLGAPGGGGLGLGRGLGLGLDGGSGNGSGGFMW